MSALDPLNGVVAWVIMHIHTVLGHLFGPDTGLAWGLSIVILVVLIRLCLVPLFVKQVHAQRKMAQHAPHLQELRKKYKGDKQRLNEETMKFYKENGVNPLAGCLPMIPQMIVFFALFSVLRAIAGWKKGTKLSYGLTTSVVESAQKAKIFGVRLDDKFTSLFAHPSLSPGVAIVIALTVVVSATTTFMTVRQTTKRGLNQTNIDPDNPMAQSQKYMMYIVPFFSLTGLYWAYGLVLYWVTTNLWTLGQQYFMFRNWTVEPAGAAGATAPASTGGTGGAVAATQSSPRPRSGAPRTAAPKTAVGTPRPGAASTRPAARDGRSSAAGRTSSATQVKGTGSASPRPAAATNGTAAKTNGTASTRTATARKAAGTAPAAATAPVTGQASEKRRLLPRLGRAKPEPEPVDDVPTAKVVRQQPVRQAKSKRSGKR